MKNLIAIIKKNKIELLTVLLVFLFSLSSVVSLFHTGFPRTDDGNWMVIRFSAFVNSLYHGQFPVRFLSQLNHGFGYPVATFLYPGFMYLGVPLKLIGLSYVGVIKTLFIFSMLFSSIGMYLFLRTRFERVSSFVGSLFYLYLPYHLYDLTVRGSLGELMAICIAPFLLFSLVKGWNIASVLLTALLILSHNTLSLLFLPFLYGFVILENKRPKKEVILKLLLGLGTAAFFWLPAILELKYTVFSKIDVSSATEYFAKHEVIGLGLILCLFLGFLLLIKPKKLKREEFFILIVLISTVFLSSFLSKEIWNVIPSQLIQFPFRFLSLSIFAASIVVASYLAKSTKRVMLSIAFLLLLFLTNSYFFPVGYDNYEDGFYSTNQATTTVKDEYMPIWVKSPPSGSKEHIAVVQNGKVTEKIVNSNHILLLVDLKSDEVLQIQRIYYPGFKAFVDGQEVKISFANDKGLIEIPLKSGSHSVEITFSETPLRMTADIVSIGSILLLFIYAYKRKKL